METERTESLDSLLGERSRLDNELRKLRTIREALNGRIRSKLSEYVDELEDDGMDLETIAKQIEPTRKKSPRNTGILKNAGLWGTGTRVLGEYLLDTRRVTFMPRDIDKWFEGKFGFRMPDELKHNVAASLAGKTLSRGVGDGVHVIRQGMTHQALADYLASLKGSSLAEIVRVVKGLGSSGDVTTRDIQGDE